MSVSRQTIADILNIHEDEVRCENCVYGRQWISNMFKCSFWDDITIRLPSDAFCTFFRRDENGLIARRMEEVVRCRDCVNRKDREDDVYCSYSGHWVLLDGFCSEGERKDQEDGVNDSI